jgi:hypothetical protein
MIKFSLTQMFVVYTGCYRWESNQSFPGCSSDDSVLNLSRECTSTSTAINLSRECTSTSTVLNLSRECSSTSTSANGNVPLEGSSSELSSQNSVDQSSTSKKSKSSVSSSNFSISSLTKDDAGCTSTVVKEESDSEESLNVAEPEPVKEVIKEEPSPPSLIKDSDTQDSYSSEGKVKPKDSEVSTADVRKTKGVGFYTENSG